MKTDLFSCQCLLLAEAQPETEAQGRAGQERDGGEEMENQQQTVLELSEICLVF